MDYNNYADTSDFLDFLLGLKDLTNNRCKVLILDLRDNPGGVLLYGLSMLNRIIPDKDVAYFGIETRDENGLHTEWNYSEGIGPRLNQIIILQNGGTASAAEVVSSSLHDLGYAITVGEDTLGKARMQNHLTFTDGSAAVITTGRLVPPSQLDFEGMGLFPDWLIPASGTAHPAAGCDLLTSEPIPMNSFSANGKRLNEALIALGYLDAATLPKGTGWVDAATMAGLRKFQDDYHLIHRATVDAASVDKLNAVLTDLREGGDLGDRQLAKALELARPYLDQPLQYTVDELGNVTNLR
jgi:carboxyl-terminal processing protease